MPREKVKKSKSELAGLSKEPVEISVPISEWSIPDDIHPKYVSNIVIQLMEENHFKIGFFDVRPTPIIPEKKMGTLVMEGQKVKAVCVSSIVVTPDKLRRWVKVFSDQLDRFFPLS